VTVLTDEIAAFIAGPQGIMVATRSPSLEPNATRACGLVVAGADRIAVLLPRATAAQSIANLEDNHAIAVVVSSPIDYRTVQLKGRSLGIREASADDLLVGEQLLRDFGAACERFGITRQRVRNLWLFDLWRIEVLVTAVYGQTPGPGAGGPLP